MIDPALLRNWAAARLLPAFLPIACAWVRAHERAALAAGVPLNELELGDARALGVRHPERVRLRRVERIRAFEHRLLTPLSVLLAPHFATTSGIALGHAILIRADSWRDRRLIAHELAHVAQYERLGGIEPFLRQYLGECLVAGYPLGSLEQEAIAAAREIRV